MDTPTPASAPAIGQAARNVSGTKYCLINEFNLDSVSPLNHQHLKVPSSRQSYSWLRTLEDESKAQSWGKSRQIQGNSFCWTAVLPFQRWENWGSERLTILLKVIQNSDWDLYGAKAHVYRAAEKNMAHF